MTKELKEALDRELDAALESGDRETDRQGKVQPAVKHSPRRERG